MQDLVSSAWLADEGDASDLRILDATKFLPEMGRDAAAEYAAGHIPGASYLDLEGLADPDSTLPAMLPPAELFAARMEKIGLGDGSRIVLYDDSPLKSSARAWWMLKVYGAQDVAILDGGLGKWKAEGRPLETGTVNRRPRHFTAWMDRATVRDKADVLANLVSAKAQVADARSPERYAGTTPESRPGVAPGHIPGSVNLPYTRLFHDDGTWKRGAELASEFVAAGIDPKQPLITSCGSGMTAAVLLFAAWRLGMRDIALYDGSWTEYGGDPATPKAIGPGDAQAR